MGTVFITGASGFFGKALIQALCQTNADHHYVCPYNSNRPAIEDYRLTWKKPWHGSLISQAEPLQEGKPFSSSRRNSKYRGKGSMALRFPNNTINARGFCP